MQPMIFECYTQCEQVNVATFNRETNGAGQHKKIRNQVKSLAVNKVEIEGLRYINDALPGISRTRNGDKFLYLSSKGRRISSKATLERIKKLAIPPAYSQVWICPHPSGHLQATGVDARGRKQYRYHNKWRIVRDADKFKRMHQFGTLLPSLRTRLKHDLALPGLPQKKIMALVVALLQTTLVRVGNLDYVRQNGSYGLTTLRDHHVRFMGKQKVKIQFRGKSGKIQSIELSDQRLARIMQRCQELPGQQLFQYVDEDGGHRSINSGMVNDYLLEVMGEASDGTGFTAKDFRTWGATLLAIQLLAPIAPAKGAEIARVTGEVCKEVAAVLGNTPAVCRKSYINPWIFAAWSSGIKPKTGIGTSWRSHERYALKLLSLQRRYETT